LAYYITTTSADSSWITCRFFFFGFELIGLLRHCRFVISAPEFSLVSFDQSGFPLPLPPALGDLPLYPDDDGFFSVNGPLDLAVFYPPTVLAPVNHDNHSTISRFINEIPGFPGLSSVTKRDRHLCSVDDDVVPRFVTSPPSSATHYVSTPNYFIVSHEHVPRGAVTLATSQVALGHPRFRLSKHSTATTK